MMQKAGKWMGMATLFLGVSGEVWADIPPDPTSHEVTRTIQTVFAPTWLEWTLFGVINVIIVAIYVVLWYRGTLRRPQNVFQEGGPAQS